MLLKMPEFQDRYGTGSNGKTGNSNIYSWGPKLNSAAQTGYEPDDFFDTGAVYTNSVTLSTGTDKIRLSFLQLPSIRQGWFPTIGITDIISLSAIRPVS